MWRCRMVEGLFRFLPFSAWQDWLIRRHVLGCPQCSAKLAALDEVRALLVQEQELGVGADLWPVEKSRLRTGLQPKTAASTGGVFHSIGRWAAIAVGLTVAAATSLWLYRGNRGVETTDRSEKMRIDYIRIEDRPARAYVYQPQDMDMTLVWVEKNGEGE